MSVGRCDVALSTARLVADALAVPTRVLFHETAPGASGRPAAGARPHRSANGKTTSGLPRQRTPGPCRN
ncbi:hypothetical protein I5Q34_32360 [Streptomyces sp. AV19]|uniref:hypothetical protein n=1 Tax=Streptomyces sp. AV19 TaxID=2793068 RepID=UPI0018FE169D|nr:hypothetical protein [Streptomyces sp. AV19]MBH1938900.1 hypothetical protein [Streptomyces sp. AV19]MDG4533624.1 hypothetical protein [Streptomyces sp. AV19]